MFIAEVQCTLVSGRRFSFQGWTDVPCGVRLGPSGGGDTCAVQLGDGLSSRGVYPGQGRVRHLVPLHDGSIYCNLGK